MLCGTRLGDAVAACGTSRSADASSSPSSSTLRPTSAGAAMAAATASSCLSAMGRARRALAVALASSQRWAGREELLRALATSGTGGRTEVRSGNPVLIPNLDQGLGCIETAGGCGCCRGGLKEDRWAVEVSGMWLGEALQCPARGPGIETGQAQAILTRKRHRSAEGSSRSDRVLDRVPSSASIAGIHSVHLRIEGDSEDAGRLNNMDLDMVGYSAMREVALFAPTRKAIGGERVTEMHRGALRASGASGDATAASSPRPGPQ